jgi:hypothetical protein
MPRTKKKATKRTSKKSEMYGLELPGELLGESKSERGVRSTRPRTAARSSTISRTSIKTPRGGRARKTTVTRTSRRAVGKKTTARGRAAKRGKRSR